MKKMSKILSIILAISMVISMIPMSFAAEGENTKIVYDFIDNYTNDVPYTQAATLFSPTVNLVDTYEKTNGFWKFFESEDRLWINQRTGGDLHAYFSATSSWFAIKVQVPVSDTYTAMIGTIEGATLDSCLEIYVLDGNSDKTAIANCVNDGTGKVGSVSCLTGGWSYLDSERRTLGTVTLNAGEHIVVFHAANGKEARIWSFVLTAGANATNIIPMSVTASANKTSLDATTAGDNAQISVSSVMYSDTTTKTEGISATDFVYTSSDTSLATVDEAGKVTVAPTALPGKVDISIAAKENPEFVLKTFSFDVASNTTNTKIVYDFVDNYAEGVPYTVHPKDFFASSVNEVDTYEKSNGFWKFALIYDGLYVAHRYNTSKPYISGLAAQAQYADAPSWYAIKLRVPVSDIYKIALQYRQNTSYETDCRVYLLDGDAEYADVESAINTGSAKVGAFDGTKGTWDVLQTANIAEKNLSAGEYLLVFYSPNKKEFSIQDVSLTAGNGTNIIPMSAELSVADVEAGKSTAIILAKAHMSDATAATSATGITYESSDSNILAVSGNNATGVKAGTAKVYVKYNNEVIGETEVTVTEPVVEPAPAPITVNYGVFVNEKACASAVTANGVTLNATTGSATDTLTPGTALTAVASDTDDYTFRYWVLGSVATGRYYSSEPTVTVKPYANIALTAIYTAANDGMKVVDLFNYNGEFLKTLTDLSELESVKPTMIGHTFDNKWLLADKTELTAETELTAPVTQAVAQYTKNAGYEAEVINADSDYGWTRNGKLVTYDENYTFFTWLNEVGIIAENQKAITDKIPLAVLESKDGAYMLEYDKGECEVVEAGILFGKNGDPTVESATSKAKVSEKYLSENDHGQMTATSMTEDETNARGYIIYKDGNEYKVIYAD